MKIYLFDTITRYNYLLQTTTLLAQLLLILNKLDRQLSPPKRKFRFYIRQSIALVACEPVCALFRSGCV